MINRWPLLLIEAHLSHESYLTTTSTFWCQHIMELLGLSSLTYYVSVARGNVYVRLWFYHIRYTRRESTLVCGSLSFSSEAASLTQITELRKQKGVLAPRNIPPHHHFRCIEVCVFVRARVRVFKWDNGVNLKTMLCACQGFEAEPSTVVPRGIYPESLPTTLLNSTSVRFYNTIVRLNRFLFGCVTPPTPLLPRLPLPG